MRSEFVEKTRGTQK